MNKPETATCGNCRRWEVCIESYNDDKPDQIGVCRTRAGTYYSLGSERCIIHPSRWKPATPTEGE